MLNRLKSQAEDSGDHPFVVAPSDGNSLSFSDVLERTRSIASGLAEHNTEQPGRLGYIAGRNHHFISLYFACVHLGHELVLLDPELPERKLTNRLERTGVELVIDGTTGSAESIPDDAIQPGDLAADDSRTARNSSSRTVDHRLLVFTSGSTGQPKAVRLSWENMIASAKDSARRLGVEENDWWLSPIATHHVGGVAPAVRSLVNGTTVSIVDYDAKKLASLLDTRTITGLSLVPTMLRDLLDLDEPVTTESLRFVLLGGAKTPPSLRKRAIEGGFPIHPTYGMTETASQIATASPEEALEHPNTVGKPLASANVSIVDNEGGLQPAGRQGEIVVSGPMITEGYDGAPELNEERFTETGFRTGDLGSLDPSGRLEVHGRRDRSVVSGGEVIHPGEIEEALEEFEEIQESRVLGVDDDRLGTKLLAVLVPPNQKTVNVDSVKEELKQEFQSYKVPREWYVIDDLPRTASGTIDDNALRAENVQRGSDPDQTPGGPADTS